MLPVKTVGREGPVWLLIGVYDNNSNSISVYCQFHPTAIATSGG